MVDPFLIELAIQPAQKSDLPLLLIALEAMSLEDPTFGFSHDGETNQIVVRGIGEVQLDEKLTALRQRCHVDVGPPQVAYREALLRRVEIDETHKKQIVGAGQFARVKMIFEPNAPGAGSRFESQIVGGAVPQTYISGVEKGIKIGLASGILAGFPVDAKATLIDGAFHDGDSSVLAFEIVARAACRNALADGRSVLLEPLMKVEVTAPEDYIGFIMGDLRARRGQVEGQDLRGATAVITAMVPLANTFGYINQLRSGTQGRGSFSMRFSHYAPIPPPDDDGPFAPAAAKRA